MTLTMEDKNSISLTMEEMDTSPTWDEATMTWNEATGTWEKQGTVFTLEEKNSISLTMEDKI
jgi:hypothetical protein